MYGFIGRCDLFGGHVSLRVDFKVSDAQSRRSVLLFVLSENLDIELYITPPASCLPIWPMLPTMMIMDQHFEL